MLKKYIKYLIYKNYNWQVRVKSKNPENNVIYAVAFPIGFLCLACYAVVLIILDLSFNALVTVVISVVVISSLEYLLNRFIKKHGMLNIIEEFSNRTRKQELIGSMIVVLFTLGSVILPFIITILLVYKNTEIIW